MAKGQTRRRMEIKKNRLASRQNVEEQIPEIEVKKKTRKKDEQVA